MHYWLVMPAAGLGRRFGDPIPKQYARLRGRTVLQWALAPFLADSRCSGITIALSPQDPYWAAVAPASDRVTTVPGGAERSISVLNALRALETSATADDWILVHDAARPCIHRSDVDALVTRLDTHPVGGLLAVPAADTLKRASATGAVEETVERKYIWRALTPQMFRYAMLRDALESAARAGRVPTDEAQAIEWAGRQAALVEGRASNIKITTADDLVIAEALLSHLNETAP